MFTINKEELASYVWNVILCYPILRYEYDTGVKTLASTNRQKNHFCSCLHCLGLSVEFVFSAMLRSLVKTRLCASWNFSHFNFLTGLCHSASFTTPHFPSDRKTSERFNGSSTNEQEINTSLLCTRYQNIPLLNWASQSSKRGRKTEHIFASDTSMSTDIPREIRWGPRPGRPQVSWVVLFMEIFPIQPHCTADSADRTNEVASVVTSRQRRHESLKMVSMVSVWTLCSLIWLLLLFTSNSDAVHPSAVYRSFHQNDHFTVPLPNSTLSAKCKAAYDKLRNPDSSSDVTELVACKFVRSARFFFRHQG